LEHVARWRDCTACPLSQQRSNIVLARGQVPCEVLFIGEAPGASEDALGLPFVGPAGHLLDQIVDRALLQGTRYALTNLVCCFPRDAKAEGYNEPEHSEILACRPRLVEFIRLAKPKLVVCVGSLAWQYVEHDAYGMVLGAHVIQIVHPAAILRMPLAQKQMAVQKAVVVLRNAVEDVLQ
jgi:DNA polymerase